MRLGMVGLGKMGANMARRLMRGGHEVVVTDLSADAVKGMASEGAIASSSLEDFCSQAWLSPDRMADGPRWRPHRIHGAGAGAKHENR